MQCLRKLIQSTRGQDLAEYAILFSLIAVALIASVTSFGSSVGQFMNNVANVFGSGIGA